MKVLRIMGAGSLAFLLFAADASAQVPRPPVSQIEAIDKLEHWVGEWKGTGWAATGPQQRAEFAITESIQRRIHAASPLTAQSDTGTFRIHAPGIKRVTVHDVRGDLAWSEDRIAGILGVFPDTVSVRILPDRQQFSAALREAWGLPDTACWMVGAADDHVLYLLAPDVWGEEACDHDPGDELHRRMLVAHEAVHVFHGQVNPSEDLGLLEDLGWFIEGLATYASGQFDSLHAARVREAFAIGALPERLDQAWSGPYRYGVAGAMVAFIDQRWGRQTLRDALAVTSQEALLTLLATTESAFLKEWETWAETAGSPGSGSSKERERGTERRQTNL